MEQQVNKNYWCSPIDILAAIIIIGGFIAVIFGVDGVVKVLMLSVVAFYFGLKTNLPSDNQTK